MITLFRWKNIVIIWVTVFILPGVLLPFDEFVILLLKLTFLALYISCLAIFGYLINDAYDLQTDAINQPQKKSLRYSKSQLLSVGCSFLILGLIIPFLGLRSQWPVFLLISILCGIQLWSYSKYFKCTPLIGNFIVGIFCAGVPFTLFFIIDNKSVQDWIWAYTLFAFLTTLLREVVKDIEDIKGDTESGCGTLPVNFGVPITKTICLGISIILFLVLVLGIFFLDLIGITVWLYLITLPSIVIYIMYLISKSNVPNQFSFISKIIKGLMLCGLLFLILQNWIK